MMAGKRRVTEKTMDRICERLGLEKDDVESPKSKPREVLGAYRFEMIAEWEHYAILSLSKISNHKATAKWISARLGISEKRTRLALGRLMKSGLLKVQGRKMVQTSLPLVTTQDVPSAAIKRHHLSILRKGEEALYQVDVKGREYASFTLAIDSKELEKTKKRIRHFCQTFCDRSETERADSVYHLALQFFPVNSRQEREPQ